MFFLSEINTEFFVFGQVNFNEEDEAYFDDEEINWTDVQSLQFTQNKEDAVLRLKDGKQVNIPSDTPGIVTLFKCMPDALNQDGEYLQQIENELENCPICGNISVWKGECHACHGVLDELEDEASLREEQLELFSTLERGEAIDWEFHLSPCYQRDPSWKILVTEAEIMKYSEENNWPE